MDQVTTIVSVVGAVLGSAGIWKFFENRSRLKYAAESEERDERSMYRNDLKQRVEKLENQLQISLDENKRLHEAMLTMNIKNQDIILGLNQKITTMEGTIKTMQKEVNKLEQENSLLRSTK